MSTQFMSIWPIDWTLLRSTTPHQSRPGSDGNKRGTTHFSKLLHYRSLIIRLFSVISRILVAGSYPSAEMQSVNSTVLANSAKVLPEHLCVCVCISAAFLHYYGWVICYWSIVKLGKFRSQLDASSVFSHTEVLWYNETVCLWMTIYTLSPPGGWALWQKY